ncbi:hypothetical protein BDQ17DRAFT_1366816 [Cyathus striatus]|nr:hypothetical protein BDQ17DRAFT_1366816 [Cyathus striatus]
MPWRVKCVVLLMLVLVLVLGGIMITVRMDLRLFRVVLLIRFLYILLQIYLKTINNNLNNKHNLNNRRWWFCPAL